MTSRRGRDERGFTLPELMVAITILAVVLAGTYQGLSNLQTTATGAGERLVNLDEARVLMSTITKDLRTAARLEPTASPFLYADGRKIVLYANINTTTGPNKVTIYVDPGNRLVEETVTPTVATCPPCWAYTNPPKIRVVGRWVANTGPLFTYYDASPVPVKLQPNGGPLTDQELKNIKSIEIELSISRKPQIGARATTLINRVRLPNVDYNPLT
jgi:prepilin-type N-terminal cleavage/methylation domain-containing protein